MISISLHQPWASLMVHSDPRWRKRIETRHWATNVRGLVVIHAAKRWTDEQRELCEEEPFTSALDVMGHNVPLGCFVGAVKLIDCRPVELITPYIGDVEKAFGNYAAGRFGWITLNAVRFPQPIPARGRQAFFNIEPQHETLIKSYMERAA